MSDINENILPQLMWKPNPDKKTNLGEFRNIVNKKHGLELVSYQDLHKWSVSYPELFWEEVWHYCKIVHSEPYTRVLNKEKPMNEIPQWFKDAKLNYAENLLRFNDDRVALYGVSEGTDVVQKCTYKELRTKVALYAQAMKDVGVSCNDRVVGYIPNCIDAVAITLAAASLGAVWSSSSTEFGVTGVLDRFSQIQPKLLFSVNCVMYNGKVFNHLDKLQHVAQSLPDLQKVIILPILQDKVPRGDISSIPNAIWVEEFLSRENKNDKVAELKFEQVPFNHPLFIMFSSGTTGVPKCIVHSVGGTLIKHLEEHVLQGDLSRKDVFMYFTTTGWMMWNWLITALAVGASVVVYDGSPLGTTPYAVWDLVENIGITILGTSAKWLSVIEEKNITPIKSHSLNSLRAIFSTGSPLKPASFDYVYRDIKKDVQLSSITGGTDIIACFAGQNPILPVYRGEIQSLNLGCAIECWDYTGVPVIGESGEMVCTVPFPSMPTMFWNDPDGSKYKNAYFSKYKGIWYHGDFCKINSITGGLTMLGRSDGTLNPNGVRFGSAEIYNIVEGFKEIDDSVCVAQRNNNGEERVILFLKMIHGYNFTTDLIHQIKTTIRANLSPRHVPAVILETKEIPYTVSGKKVEIAVRDIIAGKTVKHKSALSNPQALDLYENIAELETF